MVANPPVGHDGDGDESVMGIILVGMYNWARVSGEGRHYAYQWPQTRRSEGSVARWLGVGEIDGRSLDPW